MCYHENTFLRSLVPSFGVILWKIIFFYVMLGIKTVIIIRGRNHIMWTSALKVHVNDEI